MPKIPTVDSWTRSIRATAANILLEPSPYETDGSRLIGKDPRKLQPSQFHQAGIAGDATILEVIRAKCMDCCGEQSDEVRKCVQFSCPNWPYRMGSNPFRTVNLTDEERARRSERGKALAARRIEQSTI